MVTDCSPNDCPRLEWYGAEFRNEAYLTATQLFSYAQKSVFQKAEEKEHHQTPKFEPLIQMHKDKSCDGQFLFFANPTAAAAGSPVKAAKELNRKLD